MENEEEVKGRTVGAKPFLKNLLGREAGEGKWAKVRAQRRDESVYRVSDGSTY